MEVIIHPGMHKTGTSSIQATLVKLKPEGWTFRDDADGNMSGMMAIMFHDRPEEYHSIKARGLTREKVAEIRTRNFDMLDARLALARSMGQNAIFTGEDVSTSTESEVLRLSEFYKDRGYAPRVVAYVRRPVSFMQSSFQQRLKADLREFSQSQALWPNYRKRFEKLDSVFGKENVTLKLFDPASLVSGDVCVDFFAELGLQITLDQVVRANESMSLEACALLFTQRSLGQGFVQGFEGVHSKNFVFIDSISLIGNKKFRFKRSFLEPIVEKYRSDIDWIEVRLGVSILDLPEEDEPDSIGSEEDLLQIADRNCAALEDLLFREIKKQGEAPRDRLIRNLELLRKMHY